MKNRTTMRTLKTMLVSVYVLLIILLLLSLVKCGGDDVAGRDDEALPPVKETFNADVVMCVDCTGSMDGIIDAIKSNVLDFYPDLRAKCRMHGKVMESMRIRVIGFRDYDHPRTFEASDFFSMPEDEAGFKSFVSRLVPEGGDDTPERGYDALALAIRSHWRRQPDVHQVIILWTDAPSHPLNPSSPGATDMEQLTALWQDEMSKRGKRLIMFSPDDPSWAVLRNAWDNVAWHEVGAGMGLSDMDYEEIVEALSETI